MSYGAASGDVLLLHIDMEERGMHNCFLMNKGRSGITAASQPQISAQPDRFKPVHFGGSNRFEKRSGYFGLGAYMGLEESRRRRLALELESTFRVLRIRRLAGLRF